MAYGRVVLRHEVEGDHIALEPGGLVELIIGFKRSKTFKSLVEEVKSPLAFYGRTRDWILNIEAVYGPDAMIGCFIDYSEDDEVYEEMIYGNCPVATLIQDVDISNDLDMSPVQQSFWVKFINRFETPVDVQSATSLDGNTVDVITPINPTLSPQIIQKVFRGNLKEGAGIGENQIALNEYIQFDFEGDALSEIETKYSIGTYANPGLPVSLFEFKEAGDYAIDLRIEMSTKTLGGGVIPGCSGAFVTDPVDDILQMFIQYNDEEPIELIATNVPGLSSIYTHTNTRTGSKVGDKIRIYAVLISDSWQTNPNSLGNILIWGRDNSAVSTLVGTFTFNGVSCDLTPGSEVYTNQSFGTAPSGEAIPTYLEIIGQTTYPATEAQGQLIHDNARSILDRITDVNNSLISPFLGGVSSSPAYGENGCGYLYGLFKGLQIRQYTLIEKPHFASFREFWEGIEPILNVGLGYTPEGKIEIAETQEFYDTSQFSVLLSNVRKINRKYDQESITNLVEIGYDKGQRQSVSGIDDPQTKRKYSALKNIGKKLTLFSTWFAASLGIEDIRRTTKEKSKDDANDNDTIIIALQEATPGVFTPELSENFTSVTNLLNEETRYNKRITAARNMVRRLVSVCGALQKYLSTPWKFSGGDGNYDMSATMDADGCSGDFSGSPLSEKQDIPVSENYLYYPVMFTIEHYLTKEQYDAIKANLKLAIGISQSTTGHKAFLIDDLQWSVLDIERKLVMTGWFKELFVPEVVDSETDEHELANREVFDDTFDDTFA